MSYGEDLAHIHDAGFTGIAQEAATFVLELLSNRGITSGRVIELGCGGGVTAARVAEAGYEVEGIDQSDAMLAIARARAPLARFRKASFLDAPLPRSHAVLAIGEVLNYAFDPRTSHHGALQTVFDRVAHSLLPRGVFVFDLAGPDRDPGGRRWTEGPDWSVLVESEQDREGRTLTRRIVAFRAVGELYRRHEEVHRLNLHVPEEVVDQLRRAGLRATIHPGYAKPLGPGLAVFVASLE